MSPKYSDPPTTKDMGGWGAPEDGAPTITCPECHGNSTSTAIVCGTQGCRTVSRKCPVCQGRGHVSEERARLWIRGQMLRKDRLMRQETLRQAARRMGITEVELSKMERGIVEPHE